MAVVLADLAIDVLADVVTDLLAESIIDQAAADAVAALEDTITQQITEEIASGATDNEALTTGYDTISGTNPDVANEFAFRLTEQGYEVGDQSASEAERLANAANEANESPADANNPDNPDVEEYNPEDNADEATAKTANNVQSTWASRIGTFLKIITVLPLVALIAFFFIFEFVYRFVCNLVCATKNLFKRTVHCAKANTWTCCNNTECVTPFCSTVSALRKFIIKYRIFLYIFIPLILIGLGVIFYRYIGLVWPILISIFLVIAVWLMCSPLGYVIVHALCGASDLANILSYI